jgi:hypothetical protein
MGKCEFRADSVRNRLTIRLSGFSTDAEMEQHVKRVIAELPKLRPGFVMVSDITDLKTTTQGGALALREAMHAYKRHGIARIVRIVGEDVMAKMQLQRLTQEAGIPVNYVASHAAAEELLKGQKA